MVTGVAPLDGFLLAMQAAGAIYNINEARGQHKLIQTGRNLEQAQFQANMEALRVESSEASLNELQQLRQNIGMQIVINAARGTSTANGSAARSLYNSEQTYGKDEKARRLNLLTKQNQLRAGNLLSGFQTLQSETKLGQSLTDQIFNRLPISGLADKFGTSLNNSLEGIGTFVGKKAGFGLNTVGGA
jgi:hypothetical protein